MQFFFCFLFTDVNYRSGINRYRPLHVLALTTGLDLLHVTALQNLKHQWRHATIRRSSGQDLNQKYFLKRHSIHLWKLSSKVHVYDDISVVLFLLFLSPKLKEMTKQLHIFLFEENKELLTAMAKTGHSLLHCKPLKFFETKGMWNNAIFWGTICT